MYPNLNVPVTDEQYFRLNKINEIKDYFVTGIKERELMSKKLSKNITSFDYFHNPLIVVSVTTGSISIAAFPIVIGAPVGMVSASFILAFSVFTGIVKKLLKTTSSKKKKPNKIIMSARSKLNRVESKISEAFINIEITHEDFMTTINEEKKYRELKESITVMNS